MKFTAAENKTYEGKKRKPGNVNYWHKCWNRDVALPEKCLEDHHRMYTDVNKVGKPNSTNDESHYSGLELHDCLEIFHR